MKYSIIYALCLNYICLQMASAGIVTSAVEDAAKVIMRKAGIGASKETLEQVTESTVRAVAKHGEECLPLLKSAGVAGFDVLEKAGEKAPEVIKYYAKRGEKAIWVISEPKKLAIFIKHGDSAADALLKHPGIGETLINRYGDNAVDSLNSISQQSAQRLSILSADGNLDKLGKSTEIFAVIRKWGDEGMDFVWKNKGAITVTALLAKFLVDPEVFIKGGERLVAHPILYNPYIISLFSGALAIYFLPQIAKSWRNAKWVINNNKP